MPDDRISPAARWAYREVARAIRETCPTVASIARHLGWKERTAYARIRVLRDAGLLRECEDAGRPLVLVHARAIALGLETPHNRMDRLREHFLHSTSAERAEFLAWLRESGHLL